MLARGLRTRLQLALLLSVLGQRDFLPLVHTFYCSIGPSTNGSEVGVESCGGRIRTDDLRVMSPTSCRCSTPRFGLYPRLDALPGQRAWGEGEAEGVVEGLGLTGAVTR